MLCSQLAQVALCEGPALEASITAAIVNIIMTNTSTRRIDPGCQWGCMSDMS